MNELLKIHSKYLSNIIKDNKHIDEENINEHKKKHNKFKNKKREKRKINNNKYIWMN